MNTSSQRFGRRNSSMANAIASGLAAIERWNDALDADEHGDDCEKRAGKATNHVPSSSAAAAIAATDCMRRASCCRELEF